MEVSDMDKNRFNEECDTMATASFTKNFVVKDSDLSKEIARDIKSNKSTIIKPTQKTIEETSFIGSEELLKRLSRR